MTAAERSTITLGVARHVAWHYGDTNLGVEPGGFVTALLITISRADESNRALLAEGYPAYVAAVVMVQQEHWGLEYLRGIVKDDLDARERGLDFGAVS